VPQVRLQVAGLGLPADRPVAGHERVGELDDGVEDVGPARDVGLEAERRHLEEAQVPGEAHVGVGHEDQQVAGTLVSKGNGAVVSTRAYLGVQVDPLNASKAAQYGTKRTQGAYVVKVESGTPAEKSGLKAGDVITAVNGTTLDNKTAIGDVLSALNVGDTATLTIDRSGQTQTLTATLVERPTQSQP